MSSLLDVLAWEVRAPLWSAVVWVLVVIVAGLWFGRWAQRAEDSRRWRRISDAVRAEWVDR